MINYLRAESHHLNDAVTFALHQNATKENHSSYLSGTLENLSKDFTESIKNGRLFLALYNETIIGLIDTFYLVHLSRSDTSILVDSNYDFNDIASFLFSLVRKNYDPRTSYSFFFSTCNTRLSRFLESLHAKKEVTEYGLLCEVMNLDKKIDYALMNNEDYISWTALFNEIFPSIYKTPETIIKELGQTSEVLLFKDALEIIGFCVLEYQLSATVIEMLGVKESFRGKGIGRSLLRQVKSFVAQEHLPPLLKLIVDTDNINALKLYFDEGFHIDFENEHFLYEDGLKRGMFHEITIEDVRVIAMWKYEGYLNQIVMTPYFDNHNLGKPLRGFEDSIAYSFYWNNELFGLLELFERNDGIEIGIAIAPNDTGKGLSYDYLDQVVSFINKAHHPSVKHLYISAEIKHSAANHIYPKYGFKEIKRDAESILYELTLMA